MVQKPKHGCGYQHTYGSDDTDVSEDNEHEFKGHGGMDFKDRIQMNKQKTEKVRK